MSNITDTGVPAQMNFTWLDVQKQQLGAVALKIKERHYDGLQSLAS